MSSGSDQKPLPSRGYGYRLLAFVGFAAAGVALLALGGVGVVALLGWLSGSSLGILGSLPNLAVPFSVPSYAPIALGAGVAGAYAVGKGADLMHERKVDRYRAALTGQETADRMQPVIQKSVDAMTQEARRAAREQGAVIARVAANRNEPVISTTSSASQSFRDYTQRRTSALQSV